MLKKVIKEIQNPEIVHKKDSASDSDADADVDGNVDEGEDAQAQGKGKCKLKAKAKGKGGKKAKAGKTAEEKESVPQHPTVALAQLPDTSQTSMSKHPGEVAFFKLLHSELKKAQHFFERAQREFAIREERVKDAMEYCGKVRSLGTRDAMPPSQPSLLYSNSSTPNFKYYRSPGPSWCRIDGASWRRPSTDFTRIFCCSRTTP